MTYLCKCNGEGNTDSPTIQTNKPNSMNQEVNEFQDIVGNRCKYEVKADYRGITNDIYSYEKNGARVFIVDGIGTPMTEYDTISDAYRDFMCIKNVRKADEMGSFRVINRTVRAMRDNVE